MPAECPPSALEEEGREEEGRGDLPTNVGCPPEEPADDPEPMKPNSPVCPQQEIIAEYHRILPELAPVRVWNKYRRDLLRSRWKEDKQRQNLEWWTGYFASVRSCPFLLGQVESDDKGPFLADLEWLIRPKNMPKVLEGKYRARAPAVRQLSKAGMRTAEAAQQFAGGAS